MIRQGNYTSTKSSNKRNNESAMCYYGCKKCANCSNNVVKYSEGVYSNYCKSHKYESSFLKRMLRLFRASNK